MTEKTKGVVVPDAAVDILAEQFRPQIQELARGIVQGLTERLTAGLSAAMRETVAPSQTVQQDGAVKAPLVTVKEGTCSWHDCHEAPRSKGLCAKHYQTQRRAESKAAAKKTPKKTAKVKK